MKKLLLLSAASAVGLMVAHSAYAVEEFWAVGRGGTIGNFSGMLPPKGLYFSDTNNFSSTVQNTVGGQKEPGSKLFAYVNGPTLLWVPGIKILGATYAAWISQPIAWTDDEALVTVNNDFNGKTGIGGLALFNLVVSPINLSWNFMPLFVSTGLAIDLPTGTSTNLDVAKQLAGEQDGKVRVGQIGGATGYAQVTPDIAMTLFLPHGFSISIGEYLGLPLDSTTGTISPGSYWQGQGVAAGNYSYRYHTGVQLMGEYTLAKMIGPWTVGIGGAVQNQLTADTHSGTAYDTAMSAFLTHHYKSSNYTVGAFGRYQFKDGLSVSAVYTHGVGAYDDESGGNAISVTFALPIF